jgi:uncharacterized protein YjgD (DUF1641 family)
MTTTELAPEPVTTDQQLARIGEQLDRLTERMDADRAELRRWRELATELTVLVGPGMTMATNLLSQAESRGYFSFAGGGAKIVDRVVTAFDEDDLAALGDNIVLILRTVKELSQPEVMGLLNRTAVTLHDDLRDDGTAHPAPGALALAKQLRDPQVRRGLDRVVTMLRTVGSDPGAGSANATAMH